MANFVSFWVLTLLKLKKPIPYHKFVFITACNINCTKNSALNINKRFLDTEEKISSSAVFYEISENRIVCTSYKNVYHYNSVFDIMDICRVSETQDYKTFPNVSLSGTIVFYLYTPPIAHAR